MSPVTTIFQLPPAPCPFPREAFRVNTISTCPSSLHLRPKLLRVSPKTACVESRIRKAATVCLFGDKDRPETGAKVSPWKALEQAASNLKKERSIEDVLRDQIQKQEFLDDGGSNGGGKYSGGGGGGSGPPSDGVVEPEDEGFSGMVDEFVQVVLATLGFIFLYMYFINGEDIRALAKDLLRLIFTRQRSIRLRRLINEWRDFIEEMKDDEDEPMWLERALLQTPSDYDSPDKYQWIIENRPEMLREFFIDEPAAPPEEQATHQQDGG